MKGFSKYGAGFGVSRLVLAAACAFATQPAFAEEAPSADDEALGTEIVVTAQKRAENVQDVPVSIVAFTGETLQKTNVVTVQDLGKIATNFSAVRGSSAAGLRLNIRGIGAFGNSAIEPSVGVYLDGVYIPRAGSILGSFLDIEGAEVLRGPQGTLFGRNSSAGALSLHSALPKKEFSGRITAEVGNGGRYKAEGYLNVPLGENVAFRVAGLGQKFRGYFLNALDGRTYGGSDDYAGRASLKAKFGNFEWTLRADYSKSDGDGFANYDFDSSSVNAAQLAALQTRLGGLLPDTNLNDRVFNQSVEANFKDRHWGLSSDLSLDVGGSTLRLINSYRDWQSDQIDGDVTFLPVPILSREGNFGSKSQNHELQFISPEKQWLGGALDLVAGLYYYRESYRVDEQLNQRAQFCNVLTPAGGVRNACNANLSATGGRNATDQDVFQTTKSFAAYGQANFHIAEPLTLVLGGRWTQDEKSGRYSQVITNPFVGGLRAPEVLTFPDLSEDRFTYRIGLNFKPSEDVLIFGSYSTGFKSGGYNSGGGSPSLSTFDALGNLISTRRVFGRESVKNYELGVKSSWLDGSLTANVTLYRLDINGYQDRSFNGVSFDLRNAGALRQQGVEFDAVLRPSRNFSVTTSVAYLDSAFIDFKNGTGLPGLGGVQDLTGKPATFSPEWSGNLGVDWTGNIGGSGLSWALNSNLSFVSDQYNGAITDANPQSIQDGYAVLGARATLNGRDDRWSLSVFGSNLTNTQYSNLSIIQVLDGPLGLRNGVFPGSSGTRRVHANPRTYGASVTFRF